MRIAVFAVFAVSCFAQTRYPPSILSGNGVTAGQCISYSNGAWIPTCSGGRGVSQSFTAQTTWTFTHNLGTINVIIRVVDASGNHSEAGVASVVDTNTARVVFSAPYTGRMIVK